MQSRIILIVSDIGNLLYWTSLIDTIKEKIGPVRLVLDQGITPETITNPYDLAVVDVSDTERMQFLITEIHHEQPKCRIIAASSTPTWKQTREVIRLGAATMMRKNSNVNELIDELTQL